MRRRIATITALTLAATLSTATPANAASINHNYCGHARSVNWVTGWTTAFAWHTDQQGNQYHLVQHSNQYTGEGPYWDLHDCD